MSAFAVHMGESGKLTNAWPSGYTKPSDRAALNRMYGLLDERQYKVCERCRRFMSARGKLDKAVVEGAIPSWVPDEWGFCRWEGFDDFEMVPRSGTCEEWEER